MSQIESRETVETFWENVYLRGQMLFDPDGITSSGDYAQPDTAAVPASRAFVIAPDQTIALAHFGHNPDVIINTIRGLLGDIPLHGDFDDDADIDLDDFDAFTLCFGAPGAPEPACVPGDFDEDDDIDCHDWYRFFEAWSGTGDPPAFEGCSQVIDLLVSRTDLSWTTADGATGYDVVQGDLQALLLSRGAFDTAVDQCLVDDSAATTLPISGDPSAGQGAWFVVRGVAGSTNMTYDGPGPSLIASRDAGIDAAAAACP